MEAVIENLIRDLPDREAALRFVSQLTEKHSSQAAKLMKNEGLLSDVLTLVSFSPLLGATLLQNPDYLWWLNRKRSRSIGRSKDELLESLARFALTNSQIEPQILFARFRRRELLRIYLLDIRRLATIAEITEEISNLADAILEYALRTARRELENRFGIPMETDSRGRSKPARFCIIALGKLGSKELNYSSDIDLLFVYSGEGSTSGKGSREAITNREFFVKTAELVIRLVGEPSGEGASYRVDLRLRPHGSIGALALSVADTIRYYRTEARSWERQVMIRSRGCAGDTGLFKEFVVAIEDSVFSKDVTIKDALRNVRLSKERIDLENLKREGFNVKLGRGGVREIEFIAQALQLAYGGRDEWLRVGHTLISLARLADRTLLSEAELTELAGAYEFLRRLEHILQMENGLQTHIVPNGPEKRRLVARRMNFAAGGNFEKDLKRHPGNVHRIFSRVFGDAAADESIAEPARAPKRKLPARIFASLEKSDIAFDSSPEKLEILYRLDAVSPHFAEMFAANPHLVNELPDLTRGFTETDYSDVLVAAIADKTDFGDGLAALRRTWSRHLLEIVVFDVFEKLSLAETKRLQTALAAAAIEAALAVTKSELSKRFSDGIEEFPLAVLGLGKLGGGGIDYDSDLDIVLVYDEATPRPTADLTHAEYYGRAVEIFVNVLSGMTRDGNLYRVDLRLRPYGKNGPSAISRTAFLEYMRETAAIWEMLAFVKLRAVGGDLGLAEQVETEVRRIIHERASGLAPLKLRDETRRVRHLLEQQRATTRKGKEIDIKYGSGGMLDVYFAMRFLQLRDNVPDDAQNRSTVFMLAKLYENGTLFEADFRPMLEGYQFLSGVDHNLRLTVGRSTRLPLANRNALNTISARMKLGSVKNLLEQLTIHRLAIRAAFENILG